MLTVLRRTRLSPSMLRITFTGEPLTGFPADRGGAHIKLFFPRAHQTEPMLPTRTEAGIQWPSNDQRPITRTYSVRAYRPEVNELDVDFVDHGDTGPASAWARQSLPGQRIGLAGPGPQWPLLAPADHAVLVGDLSALPALYALIEQWPRDRTATAFIALNTQEDQPEPPSHPGVEWRPFFAPYPDVFKQVAFELDSWQAPRDSLSGWVAGERSLVLDCRDSLRSRYGLTKANLYAVPYWKWTETEEEFHQARHTIMDAVY